MADIRLVCPHCAAINRIPGDRSAAAAKCGRCHRRLFEGHPMPATDEMLMKQIEHSDAPVIVDFWAEWCGPCHAMAPVFERVAKELEPRFRFLKLDTEAEPQPAARFGIRGIPTIIMFRYGKEIARQVGATNEQGLRAWIGQSGAPA